MDTASEVSGCCLRLKEVFSRELSRSLVDKWLLVTTTEAYDRGKKFEHYRTIPSLKHYVLIAQDRHSIDCFTRSSDGSWNLTSCQGLDGKIMLDAVESELVGAEVYDKVVFAN